MCLVSTLLEITTEIRRIYVEEKYKLWFHFSMKIDLDLRKKMQQIFYTMQILLILQSFFANSVTVWSVWSGYRVQNC